MGINVNWIAVNGEDIADIQAILKLSDTVILGLSATQQKQEYETHNLEAYFLESGWYVIQKSGQFSKKDLSKVSQEYDVILFELCESEMQSKIQFWQNEIPVWEVFHDNSNHDDPCHLEYKGDLPDVFQVVKEKAEQLNKQCDGCYYTIEIPRFLAEEYLGYKYTEYGIPEDKIITSVLSPDEPHELYKRYKQKSSN